MPYQIEIIKKILKPKIIKLTSYGRALIEAHVT